MLSIKLAGCLLVELEHFEVGDIELLLSGCYHLAEVHVGVGFQHPVGSESLHPVPIGGLLTHQLLACELIPKGYYLQLTVVAVDDVAYVEVLEFDFGVLDFFEEDFVVFDIVLYQVRGTISICCAGMKYVK